jgi:hypothetical protein
MAKYPVKNARARRAGEIQRAGHIGRGDREDSAGVANSGDYGDLVKKADKLGKHRGA